MSKRKQIQKHYGPRISPGRANFDDLVKAIGSALGQVTRDDLLGWFTHGGYTT